MLNLRRGAHPVALGTYFVFCTVLFRVRVAASIMRITQASLGSGTLQMHHATHAALHFRHEACVGQGRSARTVEALLVDAALEAEGVSSNMPDWNTPSG